MFARRGSLLGRDVITVGKATALRDDVVLGWNPTPLASGGQSAGWRALFLL
jgi:hypothetical protein